MARGKYSVQVFWNCMLAFWVYLPFFFMATSSLSWQTTHTVFEGWECESNYIHISHHNRNTGKNSRKQSLHAMNLSCDNFCHNQGKVNVSKTKTDFDFCNAGPVSNQFLSKIRMKMLVSYCNQIFMTRIYNNLQNIF